MNVLLSSVGRRAYMVKYFKEAIGRDGLVHVCNSDDKTVAFRYADRAIVSPLIYDPNYIPFLLDYCEQNKIDVLLSLFDIDLLVLAKNKDKFARIGTKVIVSDAALIEICNDKWKTFEFLRSNGFNVPNTYLTLSDAMQAIDGGYLQYPVIVKPRFGMGSIALSQAEDETALQYYYRKTAQMVSKTYLKYESAAAKPDQQVVFQQCLNGQEYGADVINDLSGNPRSVVVKRKESMRAGETDIAEIVDVPSITRELNKLAGITKHIGNMDVDAFIVRDQPYILEMNARFGGGYPFSHIGGCNLPRAIVEWCRGGDVSNESLCGKVGTIGFKELSVTKG